MKINIQRKALVSALNTVRSAASSRGSLPALANVLLRASAKNLQLTCTDQEIYLRTDAEAVVHEPGACTVRADLLHSLARSFAGDTIELIALTNDLKITCGEAKYKLGTLPTDEFPPFPKLKEPVTFELPQGMVHQLISDTAFCQGNDGERPMLKGSFMELNGQLTVAACDGRRVATDAADIEGKFPTTKCILPTKAVRELLRLLEPSSATEEDPSPEGEGQGEGEPKAEGKSPKEKKPSEPSIMSVAIADATAQFHIGTTILVTKLVTGDYPNFRTVIPEEFDGVPVGRASLLGILQRVVLLANQCSIELAGQMLTVRGKGNKEIPGEATESLLIPPVTKERQVSFETQYLIEALSAIPDDEVLVHVKDQHSPAVFRVANKNWVCVIAAITPKEKPKDEPEKKPAARK